MISRWIIPLFRSMGAALLGLVLVYVISRLVYEFTAYRLISIHDLFVWVNRVIGYPEMYVLTALLLFLVSFIYFYRRERRLFRQRYLNQIIEDVRTMAEGRFDHQIPVDPAEDLGRLATHINSLVERLKRSIDEERKAEQMKNELITNVSHDLRTPLTSITGYLGLIDQDRYRDEVELRHYVNIAYEESLRLSQLVHDLFEYTRLRNNELRLHLSKVDLVELVHQMTAHLQLQLKEAGMELRLRFEQPQLYVEADGNKLRRVIENLLSNAMKYGKTSPYVDIIGRTQGTETVLEIINYGEAIPSAELPRIFDRFYRVEKSRAEHTGGSGLGLAIAKQIVELHGGTIEAFSDEQQTVFTIRLGSLQPVHAFFQET